VPESLAGCCVLATLSASVGAGVQVQSGPERITRANLMFLVSAESSTGKSETYRLAAKPFLDFERERLERWQAMESPALQANKDMLESEIARLKNGKAAGPVEREERSEEH